MTPKLIILDSDEQRRTIRALTLTKLHQSPLTIKKRNRSDESCNLLKQIEACLQRAEPVDEGGVTIAFPTREHRVAAADIIAEGIEDLHDLIKTSPPDVFTAKRFADRHQALERIYNLLIPIGGGAATAGPGVLEFPQQLEIA